MTVSNAVDDTRKVSDPNAEYDSLYHIWKRNRAICGGEQATKAFDASLDKENNLNLLIPFSPSMTHQQYALYRCEAELPGIVAEFTKMMIGGLLRKKPTLELPDSIPDDTENWILNHFSEDDKPLTAFLDEILWEEFQTSRSWIYLDFPNVSDDDDEESVRPYPVIWPAETVINWRVGVNKKKERCLVSVIVKGYEEVFDDENKFHPALKETVWVHELDEEGYYNIRKYQRRTEAAQVPVVTGQRRTTRNQKTNDFEEVREKIDYRVNGKRITYIPAWPLNGNIAPKNPILSVLVDKETALYNKISRRNHLLYGAATYTPVLQSDMSDEDFNKIVERGLGSWIKIGREDKVDILKTPTEALGDMEKAIISNIEEMAKLGIRMLSPEVNQSGVALEIRNASQNAQLGSLNLKTSNTLRQVIAVMISWRNNIELNTDDIGFELSSDFNPIPLGADWLRLATEWYENNLIPRSLWLLILKQNDMVPSDYDDGEAKKEIDGDGLTKVPEPTGDFADQM